jgi:hypothetical protein
MKQFLLLLLPAMLLISCERQYLLPSDEVPGWLKKSIADTEDIISSDSRSGLTISAWVRYGYKDQYYFEWHNILSSSFPPVYDFDGDMMTFSWNSTDALDANATYDDYQKDKCCKEYIWKGPAWTDDFDW